LLKFLRNNGIIVVYCILKGDTQMLENINILAGNVSAGSYLIVVIVAGVLLVGAAVAGIVTKKKKK